MALRPKKPQSDEDKLAQREAAQHDVLLREVDEALRQDEMLGALKRWGRPAALGLAAGLAALAGFLWWDHSHNQAAGERGEQLTIALDRVEEGRLDAAKKQFEALGKDESPGTRAIARMMQANIALQEKRTADALKLYDAVAADAEAPKPLRDLATVRGVAANFDEMPPQQVIDKLKGLAVPGNPWFGPAGELTGIAYLKLGKNDLAGPLFAAISRDKEAPETLRARTRQMAGLLGVDAIDDTAKAASGEPQ
ncbi:MAG: hypothetical protein AB7F98_05035 [Novosphingobium sp.]